MTWLLAAAFSWLARMQQDEFVMSGDISGNPDDILKKVGETSFLLAHCSDRDDGSDDADEHVHLLSQSDECEGSHYVKSSSRKDHEMSHVEIYSHEVDGGSHFQDVTDDIPSAFIESGSGKVEAPLSLTPGSPRLVPRGSATLEPTIGANVTSNTSNQVC